MKGKIMIQGTASSVGKSVLCTALCRIFKEDGFRVAPFKAQNMALNSFVTDQGLEMGRAQVTQAEAAGIEPQVEMNPILLKPTSDQGAQVIVMGKAIGNMAAAEYHQHKDRLMPIVSEAYASLAAEYDLIVIEGAGSPAEINLREKDLVNMGLASFLKAPVLLVGDIDRGGVFASLYGTIALLSEEEQELIKGVVINKFRGDRQILEPGLKQLTALINRPILGVIPHLDLKLDDEDSVTERFKRQKQQDKALRVQVIQLPRIANFTDFNPLELEDDLCLEYIREPAELNAPDLLIIPGSKNTIEDLLFLREKGWAAALNAYVNQNSLLMGICGGFQMLGKNIADPLNVESQRPAVEGFGYLDLDTVMDSEKSTLQTEAIWRYRDENYFSEMTGEEKIRGYEIHLGRTTYRNLNQPLLIAPDQRLEGAVNATGNVFGTYLHGIFDNLEWTNRLLNAIRKKRGLPERQQADFNHYSLIKEQEYTRLAALVRDQLDLDQLYKIITAGA